MPVMDTKTILLVEDYPDDRTLTLRALRKHRVANKVVMNEAPPTPRARS